MDDCQVEGCTRAVSRAGYTLCLDHWKLDRNGGLSRCDTCGRLFDPKNPARHRCAGPARPTAPADAGDEDDDTPADHLSSRRLGKLFGLSSVKMNLILAELGWIERYVKGWIPTDQGNAMGANVREARNGVPYVVWPELIVMNAALRGSIQEQGGHLSARPLPAAAPLPATVRPAMSTAVPPQPLTGPSEPDRSADFRSKFPATLRTQDGHMVRSRAEVLIDNWLYMQGIVHAYERRLPIEAECYCDFYVPKGKGVYIEFWGRESDPKYRERMAAKQAIYATHNLRLIELGDAEIERLDDVLPRMLLRFGIESA